MILEIKEEDQQILVLHRDIYRNIYSIITMSKRLALQVLST